MRILPALHATPLSLGALITTFCAIIITRLLTESWIDRFAPRSGVFYFTETFHTLFFFACLFTICVALIAAATRRRARDGAVVLLYGFILTLFPPVLDTVISHWWYDGVPLWSYALFDSPRGLWRSFLTFFGDNPASGITYGTRIMIGCAIIGIGGYVFAVTRALWRAIAVGIGVYIVCFAMSALPSLATMALHTTHLHTTGADVAGFIASPTTILTTSITDMAASGNIKMSLIYAVILPLVIGALWLRVRPAQARSLLKNIRPVQTLYHIGLLGTGMVIALYYTDTVVLWNTFSVLAVGVVIVGVIMAWYATVIFNDIVDIDIDRISNTTRPLVQRTITPDDYRTLGIVLTVTSCAYVALVLPHATVVLLGYHAISYLYNTPPLRLKRFPVAATFLAAIASFFVVVIGFMLLNPSHTLHDFPARVATVLIVAYTISLPIKDLKDRIGDRRSGVYTIPVVCGQQYGRLIVGCGIFVSFLAGIFVLNARALLLPTLLLGSAAFWIMAATRKMTFLFSERAVLWMIFGTVALYGAMIMVFVLHEGF